MTPLQKLPKNVGDLGKFIVATCIKKLPKVQKIAQSGHTVLKQEVQTQLKRLTGIGHRKLVEKKEMYTETSVTRRLDYFFNFWPFTTMKIFPIV